MAHRLYVDMATQGEALTNIRELLTRLAPPKEQVLNAVRGAVYPGRIMQFVVIQFEEGMRGDVQVDDVQYEHMMPQTGTDYWFGKAQTSDPNQYSRIVNNIGNIVPLDAGVNNEVKNKDWSIKRQFYQEKLPNWLAAAIARENPDDWTPTKISARAEKIAKWAVDERWNLEKALNQLAP